MKNKFIKSTIILIIGSLLTKLLGFIIKIYFTRTVSSDAINLYSIIMPTYSLFITLANLGLPLAISNVIAKNNNSKKTIFSIIPISMLINLLFFIIIFISSKFISNNLLHNSNLYYPILSISFIMPFVSLSGIIRGYFFGKQKMFPHTLSNIIEQLFRLIIIFIFLPKISKYGPVFTITVYILFNILSETISIIIFLLFLPKNIKISKTDFKPDISIIKDILNIALPSTSSRIIGNISYFFEPIILTHVLINVGYSNNFILNEYGIYNAYVLSLLTIPSFFIQALNTSLIPEISKNINNKKHIIKRLNQSILISLFIGLISNIFVFIFCKDLLYIIFKTTKGINYIRFLCPFFIFLYIEGPISSILHALNYSKYTMLVTIISCIIKLFTLYILSLLHIGIYSLLISDIVNIFIVNILNIIKIKKVLH